MEEDVVDKAGDKRGVGVGAELLVEVAGLEEVTRLLEQVDLHS